MGFLKKFIFGFAALFFIFLGGAGTQSDSMLLQGGSFLQSSMQIPASMAQILQGVIIFFVLGSEFFVRYKLSFTRSSRNKNKEAC